MANYPERPLKKGRPKSSHSASKKGRVWLQAPGATDKPKIENHKIDEAKCVAGHMNPTLKALLARTRHNLIPVGTRNKAGPRPFLV